VLLLEHVDRIIARGCGCLPLPLAPEASGLRGAQRAPTHWGSNGTAARERGASLEPGDLVVVSGRAALPPPCLAAHDAEVFLVDP